MRGSTPYQKNHDRRLRNGGGLMYLVVVAFSGEHALKVQLEEVGRYSSEDEAKAAIEDFVEGVLELERPGYQGLVSKIIKI